MQIINKRTRGMRLERLKGGDVFEYENDIYIVTIGQEVVRLSDGQPDAFDLDTIVSPVDAILTIS